MHIPIENNIKNKLTGVHYAWICLYMNTMLLFSREGGSITSVDAGAMWRILLVAIAGTIALVTLTSRANAISNLFRFPLIGFFIYGMIGLISTSYSSLPSYTLWKALEILVVCTIAAIVMSEHKNPLISKQLYNVSITMIGLTLVATLLNVLIYPEFSLKPVSGLFPFSIQSFKPHLNSNSVGSLAAITAFVTFVRIQRSKIKAHKIFFTIVCTASFILLILSTSRTALAMIIGSILVYSFFDRKYKLSIFLAVIGIVGISYKAVIDAAVVLVTKDQNEELFLSMSGRTTGWQLAWDYFLESPLSGHGMAAAGRVDILGGGHGPSTLHGAIFDVLVGVGLFGAIFWALFLITPGIFLFIKGGATKTNKCIRNVRAELLGLYSAILIRTFTNSSLAFHDKETLLFVSIAVISVMGPKVYELIGGCSSSTTSETISNDGEAAPIVGDEPIRILRSKKV